MIFSDAVQGPPEQLNINIYILFEKSFEEQDNPYYDVTPSEMRLCMVSEGPVMKKFTIISVKLLKETEKF